MTTSPIVIDLISSSSSSSSPSPSHSLPPSPVPPILKRRPFPPPIRPPTPPRPNPNRIPSPPHSPSPHSTANFSTQPSQSQDFTPPTSPSNSPLKTPLNTHPSHTPQHLDPIRQTPPNCPAILPYLQLPTASQSNIPLPTNPPHHDHTNANPDGTPMSGLQLVTQILAECTDDEQEDHPTSRLPLNHRLPSPHHPPSIPPICRKVTGVGAQEEADRWRPAIIDEALLAYHCFLNALHRDVSHLCASIDVYAVREMMRVIAPTLGATVVEKHRERGAPIEYRRLAHATVFPESKDTFCRTVSAIVDDVIFRLYEEDEEDRRKREESDRDVKHVATEDVAGASIGGTKVHYEDMYFSSPAQSSRATQAKVSGVGDSSCASSRGTPVGSWANDAVIKFKENKSGEDKPATSLPAESCGEGHGTGVCQRTSTEGVRDSNRAGSSGENSGLEGGEEGRSRRRRRSTHLQTLGAQEKHLEEEAGELGPAEHPKRPAKRQKRRLSDTARSNFLDTNGTAARSSIQAPDPERGSISVEGCRKSGHEEGSMRGRLRSATKKRAVSRVGGVLEGSAGGVAANSSRANDRVARKSSKSRTSPGGKLDKQAARMEAVRRLQREARERARSSGGGLSRRVVRKVVEGGPRRSQRNVRHVRKGW